MFYRFFNEKFIPDIQAGGDSINYAALPDSAIKRHHRWRQRQRGQNQRLLCLAQLAARHSRGQRRYLRGRKVAKRGLN